MPPVIDRSPYEDWADKIVEAVADYWETFGYGPSIRDICNATGMRTQSRMQRYIERLQTEGRLKKGADVPRSIRLTNEEVERR